MELTVSEVQHVLYHREYKRRVKAFVPWFIACAIFFVSGVAIAAIGMAVSRVDNPQAVYQLDNNKVVVDATVGSDVSVILDGKVMTEVSRDKTYKDQASASVGTAMMLSSMLAAVGLMYIPIFAAEAKANQLRDEMYKGKA